LKKTRRKATYILSRLQRRQGWSGGIIGENKKKGCLQAVNIPKEPGMVRWDHWKKPIRKATYKLLRFQRSQGWSGGIIGENKKKGYLYPVKIPKKPGMVRWDHWRKQEERPLTRCQDSKGARHGQVGSVEKTRRKVTYILSRFQRSQTWSGEILRENKKKGHLQPVKITKEPDRVRWDDWIKQEERPLTSCQDSKGTRHSQVGSLEKTRRKATYLLLRFKRSQA